MPEKRKVSTLGGCLKLVVFLGFCGVAVALVIGAMNRDTSSRPAPRAEAKPTVPYEAITTCQNLLTSQAMHPSTVRFPMGSTSTDMKGTNGGYRVKLDFTAKNSFNLETRYTAICKFKPGGLQIEDFGAWENGSR